MERLNQEILKLYKISHADVVQYFEDKFPEILARKVVVDGMECSTFGKNNQQKAGFLDVEMYDIYLITKALGYNVTNRGDKLTFNLV